MQARKPRVTVGIIPREGFSYLLRCIAGLYASTSVHFDLIVVDGKPPWTVARALRKAARRDGFAIVETGRWVTQNAARNMVLARARTEYVVFADMDLIFAQGWLEALIGCADRTGAALVGPLVTAANDGEAPFAELHGAHRIGRFAEYGGRRILVESQPHEHEPLEAVRPLLFAEPCETLEPHCLLARRAIFERTGAFDEGLKSTLEHIDICLTVRRAGGTIYCEPAALVHEIAPPRFPRGLLSLPYLFKRWNPDWNRASLQHFCQKWMLPADDPMILARERFMNRRRWIAFTGLRYDGPHAGPPARVKNEAAG